MIGNDKKECGGTGETGSPLTDQGNIVVHLVHLISKHHQPFGFRPLCTPYRPSTVRGLPVSPVPPHSFLSFPITSYSSAIISNLPRCLSSSRDLSQTIATIADHRRRPHSLARLSHSGLPNMGGLVLYMVTCIYTFRTDQGSLESISKDFPCVRYVVL